MVLRGIHNNMLFFFQLSFRESGGVTETVGSEKVEPARLIVHVPQSCASPRRTTRLPEKLLNIKTILQHNNFSVRGLRSHPTTLWNSESFNNHIILLRNRPQRGSFNFVIRSRDWTLHPHPRPESCLRVRPLGQPTRLRSASVKLGARLPKHAPLPFPVRRE